MYIMKASSLMKELKRKTKSTHPKPPLIKNLSIIQPETKLISNWNAKKWCSGLNVHNEGFKLDERT
jgi:hypothetical protein